MTTAPDAYRRMLRDDIAPALRAAGFKGSGRVYHVDDALTYARVGFQASRYNTAVEVRFTVNLLVTSRAAWAQERAARPHFPPAPTPNGRFGGSWTQRLGFVMPADCDLWWTITPATLTAPVAEEVARAIIDYALPALRAHQAA